MATMMRMRWNGLTPEQYDEVRRRVRWEEDPAEGGLLHVAAFGDGALHVTDVWESAEQFQRFVEERLMPGVRETGIESEPEVELHEVHAIFAPAYEDASA